VCVIEDVIDCVSVFDGLRLVVALSVLVVDGDFEGVRDRVEDEVGVVVTDRDEERLSE